VSPRRTSDRRFGLRFEIGFLAAFKNLVRIHRGDTSSAAVGADSEDKPPRASEPRERSLKIFPRTRKSGRPMYSASVASGRLIARHRNISAVIIIPAPSERSIGIVRQTVVKDSKLGQKTFN